MRTDFSRDFDRHFAKTEKRAKRIGCFAAFAIALQFLFWLAVAGGIVYFIAFAITHWLKW